MHKCGCHPKAVGIAIDNIYMSAMSKRFTRQTLTPRQKYTTIHSVITTVRRCGSIVAKNSHLDYAIPEGVLSIAIRAHFWQPQKKNGIDQALTSAG